MNGLLIVDHLDEELANLERQYEDRKRVLEEARKKAIKKYEPDRVCGCGWIAGRGDVFRNCKDLPR